MSSGEFDPDALLARLQLAGPIRADEDGLETLHRAQAYTIPFENFDVLLGRGVNLDPAAVFAKLVRRPRGGYCFELNSLLLMALEYFGWQARPLLARVHLSGSPSGRGHMLLLVTLAGREWIADVGFGGPGLRGPLPFEIGYHSVQDGQAFRLVTAEPFGTMLQTQRDDDWQNLYSFDTSHVIAADIAYANHYTSTHPSSFFTYRRVAARPHPGGRAALYDARLTLESGGRTSEQQLDDGPGYLDALRTQFGIELDADLPALRPPARD
jgi:N-hydroxyarylamine O-acetyltransferase